MLLVGGFFGRLIDVVQAQIISIPLENPLAIAYVIINLMLQIWALIEGGGVGAANGGFFPF